MIALSLIIGTLAPASTDASDTKIILNVLTGLAFTYFINTQQ